MAEQPEAPEPSAPEGLEAVLAEVRPELLRMMERMCGNTADAEDLLQEVFLRAVKRGIPAEVRNIPAWLTTSLKNEFIDHCRKMKRRPSHEAINDIHHDSLTQLEPDGPEPPWSTITITDIREASAAIEPVYGEVYRLATFEDQSYAKIAEKLGIERSTVGTRLNRARKKLREILVARFGLEEDEP
jgi:RNA polymerase sigma-70 factor (ECF subfamily)